MINDFQFFIFFAAYVVSRFISIRSNRSSFNGFPWRPSHTDNTKRSTIRFWQLQVSKKKPEIYYAEEEKNSHEISSINKNRFFDRIEGKISQRHVTIADVKVIKNVFFGYIKRASTIKYTTLEGFWDIVRFCLRKLIQIQFRP